MNLYSLWQLWWSQNCRFSLAAESSCSKFWLGNMEVFIFTRKSATEQGEVTRNHLSVLEHRNMNLSMDKQDIGDRNILFLLRRLFLPHRLPHNDLKRQQRGKTPLCCWSYGFLWKKKGAHTEKQSRWLRYSEEKHGNHSKTQLSLEVTNSSVWRLWTNAEKNRQRLIFPIKTDYKWCFSSGLLWGDENNPWSFAFKVTDRS